MWALLTLERFDFQALLGFLLYKVNAKQLVQRPHNLFILVCLPLNSFSQEWTYVHLTVTLKGK